MANLPRIKLIFTSSTISMHRPSTSIATVMMTPITIIRIQIYPTQRSPIRTYTRTNPSSMSIRICLIPNIVTHTDY